MGAHEAKAAKAVYSYSPAKGKTLLVEVQCLKDKHVYTAESHKVQKIEVGLEVLLKHESTRLTRADVITMYLKSLLVEVFSLQKHNFWLKCTSDRVFLCLMLHRIGEIEPDNNKDEKTDETRDKAWQQIQNLLQTGNFYTSKHDADAHMHETLSDDLKKEEEGTNLSSKECRWKEII